MNNDQRKYLIAQVDSTCRDQINELDAQRPMHPSLNNYLIAAFLDGTVQFADLKPLKAKMKDRVMKMGREDVLIEETDDDDDWRGGRRRNKSDKHNYVKLIAEEIFIIPEAYQKALKEYKDKMAEIEEKKKVLYAQAKTITMKIQIGSAATLDKLVQQIDNMADLNIINSQLLLTQ